jgi:S-adenosylmethionine:tRNA ribosyltransferase-isomerase
MQVADLDFAYPESLVAVEPSRPTRVAWSEPGAKPVELTIPQLLEKFTPGDLLVVNESRVIPARLFTDDGHEILFLKEIEPRRWEVLFPARDHKIGDSFALPDGVRAILAQKGLPQHLVVDGDLAHAYFFRNGEMALPPYIQEARGERHQRREDSTWYQPDWAKKAGSVAAPTASLHFSNADLESLRARGVHVEALTLHVGAGTFFPIRGDSLDEHRMHSEWVEISNACVEKIEQTRGRGAKIWALGTTATRSLESLAAGKLKKTADGFRGDTDLFIKPSFEFQLVDRLLTNFHQPKSTLLCLVAAFSGFDRMKETYAWAMDRKFKLFSYGDLSAWTRP